MDELFSKLLRPHPEPFEYIDERTVHGVLTQQPADYMDWVRRCLEDISAGRASIELPSKLIFGDGQTGGDFRVMPCVYRCGDHVVKTVKIVGTNTLQQRVPDQITVGKAVCLDPHENFVTHVIEACLLSSIRTGACAATAVRLLAPDRRSLTVIGAGRVGYYTALCAATLDGVQRIVFRDSHPGRAELAAAMAQRHMATPGIVFEAQPCGGVVDTDVLVLCTPSGTPLIGPQDTSARLVISMGADHEQQRELKDGWPSAGRCYVDSMDSASVGDVRAWLAGGLIQKEDLTDLLMLVWQGPKPQDDRPRVFISTGSALFDNLTIGYLLEHFRGDAPSDGRSTSRMGYGDASKSN